MSTMETFHNLLVSASNLRNHYLETLVSLAKIDLDRLRALVYDRGWQNWSPQA